MHVPKWNTVNGPRFHGTTQNNVHFKCRGAYFRNVSFNIFGLWLTETVESKTVDKGGYCKLEQGNHIAE